MSRCPSRVALATTLYPESQVKPVFRPSAPSNDRKQSVVRADQDLADLAH